jgi:hypothetical protein
MSDETPADDLSHIDSVYLAVYYKGLEDYFR